TSCSLGCIRESPAAVCTSRSRTTPSRSCVGKRTRGWFSSRWSAASSPCEREATVRILVVSSYPPRHCGIGAYARDQVERFRAEGHHVAVMTAPDGHGDLTARLLGGDAFLKAARIGGGFERLVVHFHPA